MNYTNGFDMDAILSALDGRVGWRSESPSARSFESFHALCTEDNLSEVWPKDNAAGLTLSEYKDNLKEDVIQRCLSSVFSEPEYIEQVLLHNRLENSVDQSFDNQSLFCGIRLKVAKDFEKSVWIKNLTLLFNGVRTFNIYTFKKGTSAAIKTKSVTTVANVPTAIDISSDNWIFNYGTDKSDVYYIGYFQDDLSTVKALREQVSMNRFKMFDAVYMQAPKLTGSTLDQSKVAYDYTPYGLTAEVHSFRDYTKTIVSNPSLFDEVIGLSMVYRVLEEIVTTTRSNATERKLSETQELELKHYLYGSIPAMGVAKITGLNDVISQKIDQVRKTFNPKPKAQTISVC
jgi:hypothetical protein